MLLQRISSAHSVYDTRKFKKDFRKHRVLSGMLSETSGRIPKINYFLSPRKPKLKLDKRTVHLVKNILSRRKIRLIDMRKMTINNHRLTLYDWPKFASSQTSPRTEADF